MNKQILTKILEALNKPEVDVSYIRGMVEVLIEVADKPMILPAPNMPMSIPPGIPVTAGDIRGEVKSFKPPEGAIGPADPYRNDSSLRDALPKNK